MVFMHELVISDIEGVNAENDSDFLYKVPIV